MPSTAATPAAYLAALEPDRRAALTAIRKAITTHLDRDIAEGMQYGMIGYFIPHSVFPDGYHCDPRQPLPVAGLASQKSHMALYLTCCYMNPELDAWFRTAWAETGKKLDMGKGCLRFKKVDDVPLDLITALFRRIRAKDLIARYQAARAASPNASPKPKPKATTKPAKAAASRAAVKPVRPATKATPRRTAKRGASR
ncbi:MAG: DUF1801 domain-containing protein [Planctomycetaceae bacterium]|jgi:hypothetical protein|nr:DUF1801 domain-containing protein [Phycisphaerales bacterium]MCE2654019.1 DUF1801 domain-containing protein [Planctomycetaceae bacterium]